MLTLVLGPNALVTDDGVKSALVITIGKSFSYGGVNISVNFVYATNPEGNRFSIIFGYAIRKASRLRVCRQVAFIR